jgi:hypothetical protein
MLRKWQFTVSYITARNEVGFRQSETEINLIHAQGTTNHDFLCLTFSLACPAKVELNLIKNII